MIIIKLTTEEYCFVYIAVRKLFKSLDKNNINVNFISQTTINRFLCYLLQSGIL